MRHPHPWRLRLAAAVALWLANLLSAAEARRFEIPAGPAEQSLKLFIEQSGTTVVYPAELVRGVKLADVKGELAPAEALRRLVAGSSLSAERDERTGTFVISRTPPPDPKAQAARAEAGQPARAAITPERLTRRADPSNEDEAVALSPFVVRSGAEKGYVAQETLAGTRLRTPIADTPVALSVMTAELLDDLGATDFSDVINFVPSTDQYAHSLDLGGNAVKDPQYMVVRGFATRTQSRDFFVTHIAADRYATQAFTFARGPNTLLFGIGNPGGIVAVQTNRAEFNSQSTGELRLSTDDRGSKRASLDVNQEIVRGRVALRADLLVERKVGWREPTEQNKDGAYVTTQIRPFRNRSDTTINLSFEYGKRDDVRARPFAPFDGFSNWERLGTPLYDNFRDARPGTVLNANTPFARAENEYNQILGQDLIAPFQSTLGQTINGQTYRSFVKSVGRIINGTVITPNVNGGDSITRDFVSVNPLDVLRKHFNGDQSRLDAWLTSLGPGRAIPEAFRSGPVVVPMSTHLGGTGERVTQLWRNPRLSLQHRFGRNFDVELAGNMERFSTLNRAIIRSTDVTIRYDPNLYLPNGQPNPYAGVAYVNNEAFATSNESDESTYEWRLTTNYALNLNRRKLFGVGLGRYNFSTLFNFYQTEDSGVQLRPYLTSIGGQPIANVANNATILRSRHYLVPGQPAYFSQDLLPLPANSPFQADWINFSADRTRNVVNSQAAALQGYLFNDRLVLLGGLRRDRALTWTTRTVNYPTGSGADGHYPGEVNLRETWKTLYPVSDDYVTNYSAGMVLHLAKAFSPFVNRATNSQPGPLNRDIYQKLIPYLRGEGTDYGFKFSLFGGALQGNYTRYRTEQKNFIIVAPATFQNPLWTVVQLAEPEYYAAWQQAGLGYRTAADTVTRGDELQFTFNPTPNLRLRLAGSRQETTTQGPWKDIERWIGEHSPAWQAYLRDPSTTAANAQLINDSLATVNRLLAANLSVNGSPQVGLSDYSGSLSAKYTFTEPRLLRGFGVGANVSYRGPVLLGYQIEQNGTAVLGNKAHADGPVSVDLSLSYGTKLRNRYRWDVWVQVNNVFDKTDAIPTQATWDYTTRQFFITSNVMREPRSVSVATRIGF